MADALQRLRGWRPRRLDVVLVLVGLVMAVATGAEVAANYQLRSREPEDRRALIAHVKRVTPHFRYGPAKVEGAVKGYDVICADRVTGAPKHPYRLCLVVRRAGPIAERTVGGYFQPARAFVLKKARYGCWGKAGTLKFCVAKRHRGQPQRALQPQDSGATPRRPSARFLAAFDAHLGKPR